MKRLYLCLYNLFLCLLCIQAQNFVLSGHLQGARDGIKVALLNNEDNNFNTIAETTIKDGCFELSGRVEHPIFCDLTTNNLELVEKMKWPTDSIKWTYTPIFIDNVTMKVEVNNYQDVPSDWGATPSFHVSGGDVQNDFTAFELMRYEAAKGDIQNLEKIEDGLIWKFILTHPRSVVSAYHANKILKRGYNLTKEQVAQLEKSITEVPSDTARFSLFKERLAYAKHTTIGADLVNLELADTKGKVVQLVDIVPKGKFVLVDCWASWCGICLASMPQIKQLAEQYYDDFVVIGVSCDKKQDAWKNAMEKHKMPWQQYVLTEQGYKDFFTKYQVGNGVPYYIMITPDGKVMKSPSGEVEIAKILKHYCK